MILLSCQPALCQQIVCLFQCIYLSRLKPILELIFNCDAFTVIPEICEGEEIVSPVQISLGLILYITWLLTLCSQVFEK